VKQGKDGLGHNAKGHDKAMKAGVKTEKAEKAPKAKAAKTAKKAETKSTAPTKDGKRTVKCSVCVKQGKDGLGHNAKGHDKAMTAKAAPTTTNGTKNGNGHSNGVSGHAEAAKADDAPPAKAEAKAETKAATEAAKKEADTDTLLREAGLDVTPAL
jgi:hypothetical protein